MRVKISLAVRNGKLCLPVQHEVEDIAIMVLGDHQLIFFERIPLTDSVYLLYNAEISGWEICLRHS